MLCVYLSEKIRSPFTEQIYIQVAQMILGYESFKNKIRRVGDMRVMSKHIPIFTYINSAKLAGPFVNISEQVSVNSLQVK